MNSFQDDDRENEAINLFGLTKGDGGRSGTDAYITLDGHRVNFELKSTSKASVTTVRDFGPDHVKKWRDKHWLIGFYKKLNGEMRLDYFHYGSPSAIAPWINKKWAYVEPDFKLAAMIPKTLTLERLHELVGNKPSYSLEDAKRIQKKQYKSAEYKELMDLEDGYSPQRMLEIVQKRTSYLLRRGSTLNNPHIPGSHFKGWEKIRTDYAKKLREMVSAYFASL